MTPRDVYILKSSKFVIMLPYMLKGILQMQLNFEIGRRSLTRLLIREKQETQREVNMMTEADVSTGEMEVGEERERRRKAKKEWREGGTGGEM